MADETTAVELSDDTATAVRPTGDETFADLPRHSFLSRLYTGTGAFEVIGRRRLWYGVSGTIVAIAIVSIVLRGFTFGIDFKGGTTMSMPAAGATGTVQVSQVEQVFRQALGSDPESVVVVGNGSSATVQIRSEALSNDKTTKLRNALFDKFQPKGADGKPSMQAISDSAVSSTWGGQITRKAVIALVVFLVLVSLYITVRYERYMAISALTTMVFDLTVTAGVYSLVGFEVTPATVIGLLTILGFSLYDTVIVFDKVEENTHGFQHTARRTFAEQANLAINQTFMRSINTSLISVLPVLALMVVAVWLLGVGTLKDLALVQLVGIIVGTYSSIFFATPLLVSLRERTALVRTHNRRVIRRRGPIRKRISRALSRPTMSRANRARHRSRPVAARRGASRLRVRVRYGRAAGVTVRPASETSSSRGGCPTSACGRQLAGGRARCSRAGHVDGVLRQRRRSDRLLRRRRVGHLQHQYRHRRCVGRRAGVRSHADRVRLPRSRRSGRRATTTSARSRLSAVRRWCSTTRSPTTPSTPTASRSPAMTWCWRGRPSPVGSPASTPRARPATSTSPRSTANRDRRKPGCRLTLTATSSTTTSCSPRHR